MKLRKGVRRFVLSCSKFGRLRPKNLWYGLSMEMGVVCELFQRSDIDVLNFDHVPMTYPARWISRRQT